MVMRVGGSRNWSRRGGDSGEFRETVGDTVAVTEATVGLPEVVLVERDVGLSYVVPGETAAFDREDRVVMADPRERTSNLLVSDPFFDLAAQQ